MTTKYLLAEGFVTTGFSIPGILFGVVGRSRIVCREIGCPIVSRKYKNSKKLAQIRKYFFDNYVHKFGLLFVILDSSMSTLILLYPYNRCLIRSPIHGVLNLTVRKSILNAHIFVNIGIYKLTVQIQSPLNPFELRSIQSLYNQIDAKMKQYKSYM